MQIDLDKVIEYEKAGKLRVQQHPSRALFVCNYTQRVQFDHLWDDLTRLCRGLIFSDDGTIIGRAFPKFFNLGEPDAPPAPDEPFTVTEKMDGSLIIAHYDPTGGYWDVASRGSFTSKHADEARAIWQEQAAGMVPGRTYCLELIAPWNRIVVNYGQERNLYLLAVIDNETGDDLPLEDIGFPQARTYGRFDTLTRFVSAVPTEATRDDFSQRLGLSEGHSTLPLLHDSECSPVQGERRDDQDSEVRRGVLELSSAEDAGTQEVEEGYVLRYASGLRLKLKTSEYLRLHKLVTGVTNKRLWEVLAAGDSLAPFLERVPDEFLEWVTVVRDDFLAQHETLVAAADSVYLACCRFATQAVGLHDMSIEGSVNAARAYRAAFAQAANQHPRIAALLFTLLDKGSINQLVWRMIKPTEVTSPYALNAE